MKISAITFVVITTFLLLVVTILVLMDFPFNLVFYLTVTAQIAWVFTVLKVLREDYRTEKTFDDFYEDFPIGRLE